MKLIQNSITLLAIISAFTCASCKGGSNKLTYEQTRTWFEKHYKTNEEGTGPLSRYVKYSNYKWDYSKTEKESQSYVLEYLTDCIGEPISELSGTFKRTEVIGTIICFSISKEKFEKRYENTEEFAGATLSSKNILNVELTNQKDEETSMTFTLIHYYDNKAVERGEKTTVKNQKVDGHTGITGYLDLTLEFEGE